MGSRRVNTLFLIVWDYPKYTLFDSPGVSSEPVSGEKTSRFIYTPRKFLEPVAAAVAVVSAATAEASSSSAAGGGMDYCYISRQYFHSVADEVRAAANGIA